MWNDASDKFEVKDGIFRNPNYNNKILANTSRIKKKIKSILARSL